MIGQRLFSARIFLLFPFLFLYMGSFIHAQKITTTIDSTKILIGDHLHLTVNIQAPKGSSVVFPSIQDSTIKPFELIHADKQDTISLGSDHSYIQRYTLSIFELGTHTFPSLTCQIQGQNFSSDSIPIQIAGVPLDTTGQLKPIKGPVQIPYTLKEALNYFYWILLAAALLIIAWWIYRKYFAPKETMTVETLPEPPHIMALKKLKAIDEQKLWQQEKIKAYYVAVSDTIREYIENRFSIHAMEQTTDELMAGLKNSRIKTANRAKLERILTLADLAKFAKTQPLPNENIETMQLAIEFVEYTKQNNNLEDQQNNNLFKKRIYAQHEYKLLKQSQQKFNTKLFIGSILAAIIIPLVFILFTYGLNIIPFLILLTNYGKIISIGFVGMVVLVAYFLYRSRTLYTDTYRFIFASNAIIERKKNKTDVHVLFEQIKSITENKNGEIVIHTAHANQKIVISPFISHREEVKERLAAIVPVEFV